MVQIALSDAHCAVPRVLLQLLFLWLTREDGLRGNPVHADLRQLVLNLARLGQGFVVVLNSMQCLQLFVDRHA